MSGSGNEPRDEDRPRVRRTDASERRRADGLSHDERYEDVRFEWGPDLAVRPVRRPRAHAEPSRTTTKADNRAACTGARSTRATY